MTDFHWFELGVIRELPYLLAETNEFIRFITIIGS